MRTDEPKTPAIKLSVSDYVNGFAFSPDSQRIATGSNDLTARVWEIDGRPAGPLLRCGGEGVRHVAFSPSGDLLFTLNMRGAARVFDWRTAEVVATRQRDDRMLWAPPWFSKDGRSIASRSIGFTEPPQAYTLAPLTLGKADLRAFLDLLTARRMDETEAIVPLTFAEGRKGIPEYRRVWLKLHPELAVPDPLEPMHEALVKRDGVPSDPLEPKEAIKRMGQTAVVRCEIKKTSRNRDGSWLYYNTTTDYRDPDNFTIAISGATADRLKTLGIPSDPNRLIGHSIVVRGKIGTYQGRPQVLVGEDGEIWILDP